MQPEPPPRPDLALQPLDSASALIFEAEHWLITHRLNSALPGYLMVGARTATPDLSGLSTEALCDLGPLLAKAQAALRGLAARRVYIGRYGHDSGWPVHFHVIPIYPWVEEQFWRDARYRALEAFADPSMEPGTDGAELTLFVWREFCERRNPPPIPGPSVAEAISQLRKLKW